MKKFIVGFVLAFASIAAHAAPAVQHVHGALDCISSSNETKDNRGIALNLHNSCEQAIRVVVCVAHYPRNDVHDNNSLRGYWGCSVTFVPPHGTESSWTTYPTWSPNSDWIYRTYGGCRAERPNCQQLVNEMVHRLTGR